MPCAFSLKSAKTRGKRAESRGKSANEVRRKCSLRVVRGDDCVDLTFENCARATVARVAARRSREFAFAIVDVVFARATFMNISKSARVGARGYAPCVRGAWSLLLRCAGMNTVSSAVSTHCPYCALQCGMDLVCDGDRIEVTGNKRFPVNEGGLCVKGWSAAATLRHPDRLLTPLARERRRARSCRSPGRARSIASRRRFARRRPRTAAMPSACSAAAR